jgi:hypothetical protein
MSPTSLLSSAPVPTTQAWTLSRRSKRPPTSASPAQTLVPPCSAPRRSKRISDTQSDSVLLFYPSSPSFASGQTASRAQSFASEDESVFMGMRWISLFCIAHFFVDSITSGRSIMTNRNFMTAEKEKWTNVIHGFNRAVMVVDGLARFVYLWYRRTPYAFLPS